MATDILVSSISVWREQGTAYGWPALKLWITRVDSSGLPLTDPPNVVLEGPTVYPPGDTAARAPVEVKFTFDPPVELPGPGKYAFFVQDPCNVGFGLYCNKTDDLYPGGELYSTFRRGLYGPCHISEAALRDPAYDLCFKIEFCGDVITPTRRRTWGALKQIYR